MPNYNILSILVAEELFLQAVHACFRDVFFDLSILVAEELFLQAKKLKGATEEIKQLSILVAEELFLQVNNLCFNLFGIYSFNPRC